MRKDPERLPLLVTSVFVLVWAVLVGHDLGSGHLSHHDEFHTLDRSLGFVEHDDWLVVWSNHAPSFVKPPLQYALTAVLLDAGLDTELALRLWPFLFGVGTLLVTGLLACTVAPEQPWAVPASVFLLAASGTLVSLSRAGMLDTGAAFYLALAVVAVLRTPRRPAWWIVAGLAAGLGALQKTPVALIACAGLIPFLAWRSADPAFALRRLGGSGWFWTGIVLAVGLALLWPAIQTIRFGDVYLHEAVGKQMVDRFAPWRPGERRRPWFAWVGWLRHDAPLVWSACVLLLAGALCASRFRRNRRLMALAAVVLVFGLAMTFAPGATYPRFLLQMMPFLAVIGGVVATHIGPAAALAAAVCLGLATANFSSVHRDWEGAHSTSRMERITLATHLGAQLTPEETPVFVRPSSFRSFPTGLFLGYVVPTRRVMIVRRGEWEQIAPQIAEDPRLAPPYRGIAQVQDLATVEANLGKIERVETRDGFVIFKTADP